MSSSPPSSPKISSLSSSSGKKQLNIPKEIEELLAKREEISTKYEASALTALESSTGTSEILAVELLKKKFDILDGLLTLKGFSPLGDMKKKPEKRLAKIKGLPGLDTSKDLSIYDVLNFLRTFLL
jgi:hypothetical protein